MDNLMKERQRNIFDSAALVWASGTDSSVALYRGGMGYGMSETGYESARKR